ncbi:MAG: hypothetical protein GC192_07520 [Bacteroidetes bacterium]|nr:hypothetical protein [Bacteroidota bacterium]
MHKNKVIVALKSLTAEEIRQLDKFVRSPVHNQHDDVIRLFQYLRKHINGGERSLDKERVFGYLFPDLPFNMQQIHYISSYLLKVIEEFLAWQEWRKAEPEYQLSLLRSLRVHRLESQFEKNFGKSKEWLAKNIQNDTSSMFMSYQLELERFNQDRLKTGKQVFRLQESSDALDAFFVAEKLRSACILLSNQTVSKSSYDTGLLQNVLDFLKDSSLLKNPIVAIYYHAYHTLENHKNDASFSALKELLKNNRKSFNINELHDIYIFAINYCIRQLNMGEHSFMREVFDIYQMGLESDAFVQNGVMTPRTYSNIIMSGLKLNEFSWVKNFIFNYKEALPEKQREGFFNYNLARFHYEQKAYGEAMPLLLRMEYEDALLTCLGKVLLAKMHFELDESESLYSLLQSFRTYVHRKKLPGNYQEGTLNFIQFLTKLAQKIPNQNGRLKLELIDTKVVVEKEWLLTQLA